MTDYTWTGASNANWTNGANWSGGTGSDHPDDNADKAIFNSGSVNCSMNAASLTVGEISITSGYSGTITQFGAVTVDDAGAHNGNLTIGGGTWNTLGSSTSHALTVAGDTQITGGTLTCNASTINLRSGGSGNTWGLRLNSGTFNGGTGTHNIGGLRVQGGTFVWSNGTTTLNGAELSSSASTLYKTSSGTFTVGTGTVVVDTSSTLQWLLYGGDVSVYNLTIASGSTLRLWQPTTDGSGARLLTVAGDLTVTGSLTTKFGSQDDVNVTVTGDASVTGTLTGNASAISLGSLTINSGGTYLATSGTTTITGKESGSCFNNSGTFTHNNGTVSFTKSGGTWTTIFNSGGQSFYDVNVDSSTGQAIYANDPLTMLNNFTLVRGTFVANAASSHDGDITVHGLTSIGGGANATKLENDGRTLQLASVTVLSNGTIDVAEGTNNFGGIRNVGGTIS